MNRFELEAILESKDAVRYSLAAVSILDCTVRYQGIVGETGFKQKLNFVAPARAIGSVAEELDREPLGVKIKCKGFLKTSSAKSSKLVLQITEYEKGV